MARCACGSLDADPSWGQCFDCFCADHPQQQYPEPTDSDYCASIGHPAYEGFSQCYCGAELYLPSLDPNIYLRLESQL